VHANCKTRTARAVPAAAPVATSHHGRGAGGEAGAVSSASDVTLAGEAPSGGATGTDRAAGCTGTSGAPDGASSPVTELAGGISPGSVAFDSATFGAGRRPAIADE